MADTITPNLALIKPEIGASADSWGNKLNGNFDILDLKAVRQTIQWTLVLGDDNSASAAGAFLIERWNNAGIKSGTPVTIDRQTGNVTLANNLTVSGTFNAVGGLSTNAITAATINGTTSITTPSYGGGAMALSGAISANTLTSNGATFNGTSTFNTMSGASMTATNYGGTNMALGGAISSNTVTANGITCNGNLNSSATITANVVNMNGSTNNGHQQVNTLNCNGNLSSGGFSTGGHISCNTITGNGITSNGNITAAGSILTSGNIHLNGGHPLYLEASNVRYLYWDGSNYVMPGASLYTANGRLWGTSDFNYIPAHISQVVSNMRWTYAGDIFRLANEAMNEYSNAVISGVAVGQPTLTLLTRHRNLQMYTNDWYTVGGF